MIINDTIVASATNNSAPSAIGIVRLVGPASLDILASMIRRPVEKLIPRRSYHLNIYLDKEKGILLDDAMILVFKGDKSFCGEDTVEFYLHGSPLLVSSLISYCLKNGARLAKKGEFSLKALLNGKMNLLEAERTNALIHAPTEAARDQILSSFCVDNHERLKWLQGEIKYLNAYSQQALDYPEEFIDEGEKILDKLTALLRETCDILKATKANRHLFQGITVVILGEPNVGKSTLLNSILQEDKAIVTDIEGTTRDIVEGEKEIDGFLFKFLDTAGIRQSGDIIERLGIEKSLEAIKRADIILDLSEDGHYIEDEDLRVKELLLGMPIIHVITKSDNLTVSNRKVLKGDIMISAKMGELGGLFKLIFERLNVSDRSTVGLYSKIDESRLQEIKAHLERAKEEFSALVSYDILSFTLQAALEGVGELLGEKVDLDEIYTTVFENFCVGK